MRNLLTVCAGALVALTGCTSSSPGDYGGGGGGSYRSGGTVPVRGHYRSNGTYVAPHYRTVSDGIKFNDLSYQAG